MKYKIACLILAAGNATRMGGQKQLLPWKDTTLVGNMIEIASSVFEDDVFVVVGSGKNEIEKELLKFKVQSIFNPDWNEGIGTSIAFGVNILIAYDAVMMLLADQVFLNVNHLENMLEIFEMNTGSIIASNYKNIHKPAVPMLFAQNYFDQLIELKGENGAKKLLKNHERSVVQVDTGDDFIDVDTPEEYEKYYEINKLK